MSLDLTPTDIDRYGLDPELLKQAAGFTTRAEFNEWRDGLTEEQQDAAARVQAWLVLSEADFIDIYLTPADPDQF